jgi:hypothetical protein
MAKPQKKTAAAKAKAPVKKQRPLRTHTAQCSHKQKPEVSSTDGEDQGEEFSDPEPHCKPHHKKCAKQLVNDKVDPVGDIPDVELELVSDGHDDRDDTRSEV